MIETGETSASPTSVEGSAGWGAHGAIALVAAGFDAREVPGQRSAAQRRARRLDKTDAVATARALLAEPTLGPVQTLEVYDPLVAKIEAVLEHRRMLVAVRTLILHHVQDQISKLSVEIRDQLSTAGKIEGRLRRLEQIDTTVVSTLALETPRAWAAREKDVPHPQQRRTHGSEGQRRPARNTVIAASMPDRRSCDTPPDQEQ